MKVSRQWVKGLKSKEKKTVTSKLGNSTSTLLGSKSGGSRTKVCFKSKRMDMR